MLLKGVLNPLVKLLGTGWSMHGYNRLLTRFRVVAQLLFDECKIGHTLRMVKFKRVGVQTDKTYLTCTKAEVKCTKYVTIDHLARGQTIVVADYNNVGDFQFVEQIALPFKLGTQAKVG